MKENDRDPRIQGSKYKKTIYFFFQQCLYFVDAVKRSELIQKMSRNDFEEISTCNLTLQQCLFGSIINYE